MWEEEGQQQDSELWDGLDDEIGRLAPSPERLRDISMFSPERTFTGWCADQVLSPPLDLIGGECEWDSYPMYSPQRLLTMNCVDQEPVTDPGWYFSLICGTTTLHKCPLICSSCKSSSFEMTIVISLTDAEMNYTVQCHKEKVHVAQVYFHCRPARYSQPCKFHLVGAHAPGMNRILEWFKAKSNAQGYLLEGSCFEVNNLLDKNIGQEVERAEKSCSAISDSKKKTKTETPKRKYRTKRLITLDDLQQHFGVKRVEAAKTLGVSVAMFKRFCRQNGITWWNGDGCSLVKPKLLNNSVHQNSPVSKPPEVQGEKETSALLIAKQDAVTIKAKYRERILKFRLSLESRVAELNEALAKRVELVLGSFIVEYEDEDQERVWIACNEDWQECVKFSSTLGNPVIRLLVTDKVSNSEKSCKGLKRKRS